MIRDQKEQNVLLVASLKDIENTNPLRLVGHDIELIIIPNEQ